MQFFRGTFLQMGIHLCPNTEHMQSRRTFGGTTKIFIPCYFMLIGLCTFQTLLVHDGFPLISFLSMLKAFATLRHPHRGIAPCLLVV